jgi:hypothetical protein
LGAFGSIFERCFDHWCLEGKKPRITTITINVPVLCYNSGESKWGALGKDTGRLERLRGWSERAGPCEQVDK